MKINEEQLREIIKRTISEAIARQDARLANRFIRQNNGQGYTPRQSNDSGLLDMAYRAMGGRSDRNGQYDMLRSAQDIYPLIQKYNAEIKKLQTVYNYLNARKDGNYVPKSRIAKNPMSPEQKQKMLASRAANRQARADINARYGNIEDPKYSINYNGVIDDRRGIYNAARQRSLGRKNDVAFGADTGQNWFGTGMRNRLEEGIRDFFRRQQQPDEVDNICATYRRIPVEQMAAAAQKVGARLQEYKNTVAQLQGMLDKWQKNGHLVDKNAELRAQRDAELKAVGRNRNYAPAANGTLEESVKRAVSGALKKYLK